MLSNAHRPRNRGHKTRHKCPRKEPIMLIMTRKSHLVIITGPLSVLNRLPGAFVPRLRVPPSSRPLLRHLLSSSGRKKQATHPAQTNNRGQGGTTDTTGPFCPGAGAVFFSRKMNVKRKLPPRPLRAWSVWLWLPPCRVRVAFVGSRSAVSRFVGWWFLGWPASSSAGSPLRWAVVPPRRLRLLRVVRGRPGP